MFLFLFLLGMCLRLHGVTGVDKEEVSVKDGESFTLHTGVQTNQQDRIKWYFNDIRIAQISGDLSNICTDVQCDKGNERFRDRLKLDRQTGSLTITQPRNTDSGDYTLQIISSSNSEKIFIIYVYDLSGVDTEKVSRMEGDPVTLKTGVQTKQQYRITWYFNNIRIAQISGDLSDICTDVQCNEDTERFRDRLKLDHQTGSLTITHTTDTHSGEYKLWIISSRHSNRVKIFSVYVHAFSAPDPGPAPAPAPAPGPGLVLGLVVVVDSGSDKFFAVAVAVTVAVLLYLAVIFYRERRAIRNACRTNCNTQAS